MAATTYSINFGRYSGRKIRPSVDGTASTPGFFYADDSDTGIYSPSNGVVAITCDGVQKFKVDSNGVSYNGGVAFNFPSTDGNADEVLTTNGSGTLTWEEATGQAIIDGGNFDTSASLVSTTTTYDGGTFT